MWKGMSTVGMEVSQRLRKWIAVGKVHGMNGKLTDAVLTFLMYAIATTWVITENPQLRHVIITAASVPAWLTALAAYPIAWYNRKAFTSRLVGLDDFNYRFFYKGGHRRSAAAA